MIQDPATDDKRPVLLTGATGFVGRQIAARLAADGHRLRCYVRESERGRVEYLQSLSAELAVGDILDAEPLTGAAKGAKAVVHLVGIIFERRGASFEQIHVHGSLNALAAAIVAGVDRFIHMSALGAGPEADSEYHRTKWRAEEQVRESGLDYTIFRPSVIYGPGGEFIKMLLRQVRLSPLVPVIGNGRYTLQPVSVSDVAACFSACIGASRTYNQAYELGGPEALTYNQIIDAIAEGAGKKRLKLHIPVPLVRPVAYMSEKLMSKPMLTTDQLKMLLKDNICDITRMREDLGVEPVRFEDGIGRMLADSPGGAG